MGCVEIVEPRIESRHSLTPVQLLSHGALRKRRQVRYSSADPTAVAVLHHLYTSSVR